MRSSRFTAWVLVCLLICGIFVFNLYNPYTPSVRGLAGTGRGGGADLPVVWTTTATPVVTEEAPTPTGPQQTLTAYEGENVIAAAGATRQAIEFQMAAGQATATHQAWSATAEVQSTQVAIDEAAAQAQATSSASELQHTSAAATQTASNEADARADATESAANESSARSAATQAAASESAAQSAATQAVIQQQRSQETQRARREDAFFKMAVILSAGFAAGLVLWALTQTVEAFDRRNAAQRTIRS